MYENPNFDLNNEKEVAAMQNVMELEYRDWTATAEEMTKSMIASGAFTKIKNPVIAMGEIKNDTMQRFDTDILTKKTFSLGTPLRLAERNSMR